MAGSRRIDLDALDEDTLEVARAAADAAGMSLEDWLARTLGEPPADEADHAGDPVFDPPQPPHDPDLTVVAPPPLAREPLREPVADAETAPRDPQPEWSAAAEAAPVQSGHESTALLAALHGLAVSLATATADPRWAVRIDAIRRATAAAAAEPQPAASPHPPAMPAAGERAHPDPVTAVEYPPKPAPEARGPQVGPPPDIPPEPFIAPEPSRQLAELPTGGELEKAIAAAQERRRMADETGGTIRRKRASGGWFVRLLIALLALVSLAVIALLAYVWATDATVEEVVDELTVRGSEIYDSAASQINAWMGNEPPEPDEVPLPLQDAPEAEPIPDAEPTPESTPSGTDAVPVPDATLDAQPDAPGPDAPEQGGVQPADQPPPLQPEDAADEPADLQPPPPGEWRTPDAEPDQTSPADSPATEGATDTPSPPALASLRSEAEAGDPTAQRELGRRYLEGDGVAPDAAAARRWLEEASVSGDAEAQYILGTLYEQGIGIERDSLIAMAWYLSASDSGMPEASMRLGQIFRDGDLWPQSYPDAVEQFRAAADAGLPDAEYELANLYSTGQGVDRSDLLAHIWYSRAAEHGHPLAGSRAEAVAATLTPDQLAQSESLAADPPRTVVSTDGASQPAGQDSPAPPTAEIAAPDAPVPPAAADPVPSTGEAPIAIETRPVPQVVPGTEIGATVEPAPEPEAASDLLPASPLNRDSILEIQTLLNARGYDSGRPDGIAGRRTVLAIEAYQLAEGLPVTGQPSLTLLARLRSQTLP